MTAKESLKSNGGEKSQDASLATVLNEEQRVELAQLIASAMVSMRRTVAANFVADAPIKQDVQRSASSEEQQQAAVGHTQDTSGAAPSSKELAERGQKLQRQRIKDINTPEAQALKTEALAAFDKWRGQVINRVSEAVHFSKDDIQRTAAQESEVSAAKAAAEAATPDEKIDQTAGSPPHSMSDTEKLEKLYPAIKTPLVSMEKDSRLVIVHSVLLLLLSLENYVAPSRVLLMNLVSSLRLPLKTLAEDERKIAQGLLEAAKQMSGDAETKKKADENKTMNKWKVGIASVAGAALVGITGGLAAPLIAAGLGSVMGGLGLGATAAAGYLGSVAGSTVLVGGLFGAYGGRMTGKMMENYAKEVSDFAFVPLPDAEPSGPEDLSYKLKASTISSDAKQPSQSEQTRTSSPASPSKQVIHRKPVPTHAARDDESVGKADPAKRRLRVTIAITGWLTSKDQVTSPWHVLGNDSEVFALRFELEALMNLGNALDAIVSSTAWGYAKSEVVKRTVFAELVGAASWPLGLVQIGRVVDNPFTIARTRADKAGELLADALINKAQGERPVNLVGYSLGARVIYSCLRTLARRRAFDLVDHAVLIGTPCPSTPSEWRAMRTAVSGRLVNVYSTNDYILAFLYRTASVQFGVAGLQMVEALPTVENVDVSAIVTGHLRYCYLVGRILTEIGYEDIDPAAVRDEDAKFQKVLQKEKETTLAQSAQKRGNKVLADNPLGMTAEDAGLAAGDVPVDSSVANATENEGAGSEAAQLEEQISQKTRRGMQGSGSTSQTATGSSK